MILHVAVVESSTDECNGVQRAGRLLRIQERRTIVSSDRDDNVIEIY